MSFIGNVPAEAYSPVAKDTFSGNDSTTDFTLSIPATTNSVNVYVENVAQEPTTAYTISGTTLSFTAAPTTGTNNIYVIHRGPAVQQIVPPAGVALNPSTVDATGDISTEGDLKVEMTSGGIYTITGTDTATNRTLTLPDEAGTVLTSASSITQNSGPAFSAYKSSSTSQTDGVLTKVIFDTELWDLGSCYNTSTGAFTPNVAGYYQLNCSIDAIDSSLGPMSQADVRVYKNGAVYKVGSIIHAKAPNVQLSATVYANGTTDYFEIYYLEVGGGGAFGGASIWTWFDGCLVRAA